MNPGIVVMVNCGDQEGGMYSSVARLSRLVVEIPIPCLVPHLHWLIHQDLYRDVGRLFGQVYIVLACGILPFGVLLCRQEESRTRDIRDSDVDSACVVGSIVCPSLHREILSVSFLVKWIEMHG